MKTDHIISLISKIRNKANKIIVKELQNRNIKGLSPSHGDILFFLLQEGSATMADLAKKIDRDKSTVTALVKKLIALGYIKTIKDEKDNRITVVSLTEKGQKLKPTFDKISMNLINSVYRNFTTSEKEVIVRNLEKLLQNL